jgi:predicted nuclease of predicted toxin-antitoxin system
MTALKLLIDECLSQRLCGVARSRGLEAMHIKHFDLLGTEDWELISKIQADDWTFITNNGRDFLKLYAKLNIHAGLIIIIPSVSLKPQRRLLRHALRKLGPNPDLINKVVSVELDGRITIEDWPR